MDAQTQRKIYFYLCSSNFSNNAIAVRTGVSPHTVKKLRQFKEKLRWDWNQIQSFDDRQLKEKTIPPKNAHKKKAMPDWPEVHKLMQTKNQTLIELWEEYRAIFKEKGYSYSQYTYYFRQYLKSIDLTMRQIHYAGESMQVDFCGTTIPYKDKESQDKWAQIFVSILPCSDYPFVYALPDQKLPSWILANRMALEFYDGVPSAIVPDNLKSAVTKSGIDPVINRTFQEFAEHYGLLVIPARAYRPKDKGKAENLVLHATRWIIVPLRRRQFFSLEEVNEAIKERLDLFIRRPFKRIPGNRLDRFLEVEKSALKPLPSIPYDYADWECNKTIGPDYHVYVHKHAYSVPHHLVHKKVDVRISQNKVEFFYLNKSVAVHLRSDKQGESSTFEEHRPPAHRAYAAQDLETFLEWASTVGEATAKVVREQFDGKPEFSMVARKSCAHLKALAKIYGNERLEAASVRALHIASPTVKSIKSILAHRLDESEITPNAKKSEIPMHENIRGAEYFDGGNDDDDSEND